MRATPQLQDHWVLGLLRPCMSGVPVKPHPIPRRWYAEGLKKVGLSDLVIVVPAGRLIGINSELQLALKDRQQSAGDVPHATMMGMAPHEPVTPGQLLQNVGFIDVYPAHLMVRAQEELRPARARPISVRAVVRVDNDRTVVRVYGNNHRSIAMTADKTITIHRPGAIPRALVSRR